MTVTETHPQPALGLPQPAHQPLMLSRPAIATIAAIITAPAVCAAG